MMSRTVKALKSVWLRMILALVLLIALFVLNPLPVPAFLKEMSAAQSFTLLSRENQVLRKTLSSKGGRRQRVELSEVNPEFLRLLLVTEDRRFYFHPGFDLPAIARAAVQYFRFNEVVSGASTITMQMVRLSQPKQRTLGNKFRELFWAVYLEMALNKQEILDHYINHLPFGNEIYGIKEASESYFRKNPKDLSLVESAVLISLIRSPERLNPLMELSKLKEVAFRVLTQDGQDKSSYFTELDALRIYRPDRRFLAPHFSDFVLRKSKRYSIGKSAVIKSSLNLELNERIQTIVREQIQNLSAHNVHQASVLVIDNQTGEILGYVGSKDYWDDSDQGMIDGVQQFRQPGSTLKPFTYSVGIDSGISPAHILPDIEQSYVSEIGSYIPENYDHKFRGPVMMRQALANSLNVPAISLLRQIGYHKLYGFFKEINFQRLEETPDYYGLGLTLGNVETSLFELVRAYSLFARSGQYCDLTVLKQKKSYRCESDLTHRKILKSPEALRVVRDFLSDKHARRLVFGNNGPLDFDFPVMVKTGTSQNYRDNWTLAVTPKFTVGVWVGNFNGDPMQGVSGVTGAGPIVHDVVQYLHEKSPWQAWNDSIQMQKTNVCTLSGLKPHRYCPQVVKEYVPNSQRLKLCDSHVEVKIDRRTGGLATALCPERFVDKSLKWHLGDEYALWQKENRPDTLTPKQVSNLCEGNPDQTNSLAAHSELQILKPVNGVIYKIDKHRPAEAQLLTLKTNFQLEDLRIFYDSKEIDATEAQRIFLKRGKHHFKVMHSTRPELSDEVKFWVR